MPVQFTCDGANHSPALVWSGAPPETRSYALILDDPDAPSGVWAHWLVWNIPAARTGLPENAELHRPIHLGSNDFGALGYRGPCPPTGTAPIAISSACWPWMSRIRASNRAPGAPNWTAGSLPTSWPVRNTWGASSESKSLENASSTEKAGPPLRATRPPHAHRLMFQAATSIVLFFASGALGAITCRMPLSSEAVAFSTSIGCGSSKRRKTSFEPNSVHTT
jgi:hypothetical protein